MREMIEESVNLLDGICDKNVAKTTPDEPIAMWHGQHMSQTCGKVTIGDLDKIPFESMNTSIQISASGILDTSKVFQVHVSEQGQTNRSSIVH